MRPHEIENWVLQIVERVKVRQPIEDSRVELKSAWIKSEKAARQIAGHANAAHGAPILWLIGLDEINGVVGASHEELAEWYAQVKSQFNGIAPALMHYNIPIDDRTVVALLFETDRAPFVVINQMFGKTGGGAVAYEVPWRENTSTRTATRAELLKILAPHQELPIFDILDGQLMARPEKHNGQETLAWNLNLTLYAETASKTRVVIPFHKCAVSLEIPGILPLTEFSSFTLQPPEQVRIREMTATPMSLTIEATPDEILINGPGKMYLNGLLYCTTPSPVPEDLPASIKASLRPVLSDLSIPLHISLSRVRPDAGRVMKWQFKSR